MYQRKKHFKGIVYFDIGFYEFEKLFIAHSHVSNDLLDPRVALSIKYLFVRSLETRRAENVHLNALHELA